ncbi:MBL fold metallo-hydrolase [Anaeromicrobium sediminis]|uniref:Hydrolase n=1 Tax=Anaeromicrobium sediminis TaxID=1478221 RepID=A0A267MG23_9FIRM|nr:MBL fold metallo-hydrolase [Anaeromicrobium sediminis]PAB58529.1 hydrolase [Anaeromicrobium sediminis]
MKITTLIENTLKKDSNLINEHGLSILIEVDNKKILFDTGASASFINNAKDLNIKLNDIDHILLSHGHYDHCGGLKSLLDEYNPDCTLNVHKDFFKVCDKNYLNDENNVFSNDTSEKYRYVGIDFDENYINKKSTKTFLIDEDIYKLSDSVYVFSNFEKSINYEKTNENMKIKIGEEYVTDKFSEEIALGIDTPKGLLIIVGCSHVGILNTLTTIEKRTGKKIYGVIGGTHLVEAHEDRILKTIDYIKEKNVDLIGFSHCTGEKGVEMFKNEFHDFFINSTGTIIEI